MSQNMHTQYATTCKAASQYAVYDYHTLVQHARTLLYAVLRTVHAYV